MQFLGRYARIISLDSEDKSRYEEDPISIRTGDQSDPGFLQSVLDEFKIDPKVRAARRRNTPAKRLKNRAAGRGRKKSAQKIARATDPPREEASENVA